jgi:hypothetical protein
LLTAPLAVSAKHTASDSCLMICRHPSQESCNALEHSLQ